MIRLGIRRLFSFRAAKAARRLRAFLHEHRPDVLQVYFLDAAYFGAPVAKFSGVKKVVRVRNNLGYWMTRKHRALGRLLRSFVDATLTNTVAGKQALVETEGHRDERVVVLENGVDTAKFNRFMLPDTSKKRVRVGCVANLRPVKNIDGLMRAAKAAMWRFPQLEFEVAGDGEAPGTGKPSRRARVGPRSGCRIVADIPAFLRSVDIAVLPSHSEGMSNALLEYMSAGRAVVATDVGANTTLIRHRKDGLIVPAGDESAMIDAFAELLEFPVRAAGFGASARRRVETDYSRAAMRKRFEEFYRELAG